MYEHLFKKQIDKTQLKKIKEHFYSPAEIINIYLTFKTEHAVIKRLIQNKKVM
jgi:hypothetical protein